MIDLLHDVQDSREMTIHVAYLSPTEVQARWSVGFLDDRKLTYRFAAIPTAQTGEAAFADLVRARLGAERAGVTFDSNDPLVDLGGLSVMVPVLYWRFITLAWLKWAVLFVFAGVLVSSVVRESRRTENSGYWLAACLVLGSGVPAYLWSEPTPLWRVGHSRAAGFAEIAGWGVILRSICWLAVTVLIGYAFLSFR